RLPGIHLSYYQDEWKNVNASVNMKAAGGFFSHPPLMQTWFVTGHVLFGDNVFRVFPIIFSLGTLILIYLLLKNRSFFPCLLFVASFYSFWGFLMAVVDGSV